MKSNILIISEKKYQNAYRLSEICLAQMLDFLHCKDVVWDHIGEDLFTGCQKAVKKFELEFGEDVKKAEEKMYKLVKFPNDGVIRLCGQGNTKKNYKNTLLIEEHMMKEFCHDAKKYGSYTEIHLKDDAQNYRNWENYINIAVKESLNKENENN